MIETRSGARQRMLTAETDPVTQTVENVACLYQQVTDPANPQNKRRTAIQKATRRVFDAQDKEDELEQLNSTIRSIAAAVADKLLPSDLRDTPPEWGNLLALCLERVDEMEDFVINTYIPAQIRTRSSGDNSSEIRAEAVYMIWWWFFFRCVLPVHAKIAAQFQSRYGPLSMRIMTDILTVSLQLVISSMEEYGGIAKEFKVSTAYRIMALDTARDLDELMNSSQVSVSTQDELADKVYPNLDDLIEWDHGFRSSNAMRTLVGCLSPPPLYKDPGATEVTLQPDPIVFDEGIVIQPLSDDEADRKNRCLQRLRAMIKGDSDHISSAYSDQRQKQEKQLKASEERVFKVEQENQDNRKRLDIMSKALLRVQTSQAESASANASNERTIGLFRLAALCDTVRDSRYVDDPSVQHVLNEYEENYRRRRNTLAHGTIPPPESTIYHDLKTVELYQEEWRSLNDPIGEQGIAEIFEGDYGVPFNLVRPVFLPNSDRLPSHLDLKFSDLMQRPISGLMQTRFHAFSTILNPRMLGDIKNGWVAQFSTFAHQTHQGTGANFAAFYESTPPFIHKQMSNLVAAPQKLIRLARDWDNVVQLSETHPDSLVTYSTTSAGRHCQFSSHTDIQTFFDAAWSALRRLLEILRRCRLTRLRLLEKYRHDNNISLEDSKFIELTELENYIQVQIQEDPRLCRVTRLSTRADLDLIMCAICYYDRCCWNPVMGRAQANGRMMEDNGPGNVSVAEAGNVRRAFGAVNLHFWPTYTEDPHP